ncbi:MAG: arylsulfatase [Lentisphaeraceae bacterium]|nr:arylsulfatase [Lentisphaeraceae bacterium]
MRFTIILLLSFLNFSQADELPNIIYILADDLGYSEVGAYGQEKIKTPNIDQLAKDGMKFTQHYSGSAVCAPSRCVLLTGKHTGQSFIRNNGEFGGGHHPDDAEGQLPISDETLTIAETLKTKGYKTAAIGKWGLGGPSSFGHPNRQGFDYFYGHLCQRKAHNFYQTHLWENNRKAHLNNPYIKPHQRFPKTEDSNDPKNYEKYQGNDYADDFMAEKCLDFIKKNQKNRFFLYYASPVPHVSLQVPNDSLNEYLGKFKETPYLGQKGYLPHYTPRAAYAAMVTRFDKHIGQIVSLLKTLKIDENTIIMFSSDNGPTFNGGSDSSFFNSAGPFSGLKCSLKEGGIRVPFIVKWPAKIKASKISNHLSSFDDIFPTICEITKAKKPDNLTGVSLLNELKGEKQQAKKSLYWEYGNQQAIRVGPWKLYRTYNRKTSQVKTHLYNLDKDISEKINLATNHPEKVQELIKKSKNSRTKSKYFKTLWDQQ